VEVRGCEEDFRIVRDQGLLRDLVLDPGAEDRTVRRAGPERLEIRLPQRPLPDEQLVLHDPLGAVARGPLARLRKGQGNAPEVVAALRSSFYGHLAPVANEWSELLGGRGDAFPLEHEELLDRCREAGQERPTPLILRYGKGDWNALHQDLYGEIYFPFQVVT